MSKRRIEFVPLADLPEAEVNPKGHDDGLIDASFDRFGYMEPVLLDERTGRLIGGHGRKRRLEARRDAGQDDPDGYTRAACLEVAMVHCQWRGWLHWDQRVREELDLPAYPPYQEGEAPCLKRK